MTATSLKKGIKDILARGLENTLQHLIAKG